MGYLIYQCVEENKMRSKAQELHRGNFPISKLVSSAYNLISIGIPRRLS
jgi:hypothetical protein